MGRKNPLDIAYDISYQFLHFKAVELINILSKNPCQIPPPYEKLIGDLSGAYSRRINIQHRMVYQVMENEKIVKIIRMWTY
jgi:toxin YoeB